MVSEEEAEKMYEEKIEEFKDKARKVDFKDILRCSEKIQKVCPRYIHNPYQCFAAAISVASHSQVRIVEMPTGSGKTWVYSIIAKHYSEEGKGTTIIVPNETLRE